jgi:monofunctional biosynthetic peptidoglycan transglycosylase
MAGSKKINMKLFVVLFVAGATWFLVLYHIPIAGNILGLRYSRPISTSFMRYQSFRHPLKRAKYDWVSYNDISDYLKDAVVIAEDDRFFEHPGVDWEAIRAAAKKNWKRKRFDFGASTITQQLTKNLYLYSIKDPFRKLREGVIAVLLDAYLPKERILEIYLNVAQWGPNIYGAEAAAKYYFGGSAKNLNASQSAFLASILPNPLKNGKNGYHLSKRAQSILRRIQ